MSKKKDVLDAAWAWAENFDGEITNERAETAYKINQKIHSIKSKSACRRNCQNNPCCLVGFGESAWTQAIDKPNLSSYQRAPGAYVGLKNLGNTCYVNCFLQLWFHNIPLREAIYMWDAYEKNAVLESNQTLANSSHHSSVANLQFLFADMEFGLEKYSDPEKFCESLSIDVELQQDAQEFSKLYMNILEETLASSSNPVTKNVIGQQFRGQCAYTTKCRRCLKVIRRPSSFSELELTIKGCKTLQESLEWYVKSECLTGDNKYMCSNCNSKEDADTYTELEVLPPVLQLQLIRYYYDVTSVTKKKINQNIHFPDVLDMSPYLKQPAGTALYTLNAVLMHGGTSANSVHYYAHINTEDGWHIFNDTTVRKQKELYFLPEGAAKPRKHESTVQIVSLNPSPRGGGASPAIAYGALHRTRGQAPERQVVGGGGHTAQ